MDILRKKKTPNCQANFCKPNVTFSRQRVKEQPVQIQTIPWVSMEEEEEGGCGCLREEEEQEAQHKQMLSLLDVSGHHALLGVPLSWSLPPPPS